MECRIPGSDANSYLAFAATIAGGLHGIRNKIEPPSAVPRAAATTSTTCLGSRGTWSTPSSCWEGSAIAKEAFGEEVHFHLLNCARQEWMAFNRTVTDWELRRYFERA